MSWETSLRAQDCLLNQMSYSIIAARLQRKTACLTPGRTNCIPDPKLLSVPRRQDWRCGVSRGGMSWITKQIEGWLRSGNGIPNLSGSEPHEAMTYLSCSSFSHYLAQCLVNEHSKRCSIFLEGNLACILLFQMSASFDPAIGSLCISHKYQFSGQWKGTNALVLILHDFILHDFLRVSYVLPRK